jgi:hypothetical protein
MSRHGRQRNDLIIGMTLAEIFLLLLIVGWYGSRLESEAAGGTPGTPAEVLQKKLNEANEALRLEDEEHKRLENDIHNLEETLKWLGEHLDPSHHYPPIRDVPSATAAIDAYTAGLKRGKPICEAVNVLIQVVADDDKQTLTILQPLVVGNETFAAGQTLTGKQDVDGLLQAVQKYYAERRESGRDCAFDFKLDWRTDHDYRVAKKMFDPYFYPAGDRQLQ